MIYLVLSVYILNNEEFAGLGVSVVYKNIDSPKAVLSNRNVLQSMGPRNPNKIVFENVSSSEVV